MPLITDRKFIVLCDKGYYKGGYNQSNFVFTDQKENAEVLIDFTDQNSMTSYDWVMGWLEEFNPKLIEI